MDDNSIDPDLVANAAAGDDAALAELFQQYRPRLCRMVSLRMDARVRGRFDASDVVQEAFVDVARRLPDYKDKNSEMPLFLWMRLVTGDRLAQLHRAHLGAEKRDAGRELRLEAAPMPEATSMYLANQLAGQFTSVDRGLKRDDVCHQLEAALNSMDKDDREIIAMRHFEEMSTEEIAIVLGLTRSGVLKRYTRAVRKLNTTIGGESEFSLQ